MQSPHVHKGKRHRLLTFRHNFQSVGGRDTCADFVESRNVGRPCSRQILDGGISVCQYSEMDIQRMASKTLQKLS